VQAYLKVTVDVESQTRYGFLVTGEVLIDGVQKATISQCFAQDLPQGIRTFTLTNPITWTCGSKVELRDVFTAWDNQTPNTTVCSYFLNGSYNCEKLTPKCFYYATPIIVVAPLVANFSWQGACNARDDAQTIDFTSTTSGGTAPYSFSWNFGDASSATGSSPSHTYAAAGTYSVTLTVTDASNPTKTDSQTFPVTVASCCKLSITCPSDEDLGTFTCGKKAPLFPNLGDYGVIVNDNCGNIIWNAADSPAPAANACIDQTITRTITIWDDKGKDGSTTGDPSTTCTFTYRMEADNTDPVLSTEPADVTVQCNAIPAPATLTATDNCDTQVAVTYNQVKTDGACANAYTLTRTWTATDNCGNSSSKSQTITVVDNTPPTFTKPADVTLYVDAQCAFDASTAKTGNVTNEADNCSTGLQATYKDVITDAACGKVITRTWSLKDECGNAAANQVQKITVTDNIDPVLTVTGTTPDLGCLNPSQAQINAAFGTATATDNCGVGTPTHTTAVVIVKGCSRTQTRTWTATDDCGNTATASRTITWTVPLKADCFSVNLLSVNYTNGNTTFKFRVCGNNCPTALSYIAFITGTKIGVVSPTNGSTFKGVVTSYKVSVPVSSTLFGVKYESLGEGIKYSNQCEVFTFTLAGDRRTTPITVQTKAGTTIGKVVVDPCYLCLRAECSSFQSP
jgi:PKD repeat protein